MPVQGNEWACPTLWVYPNCVVWSNRRGLTQQQGWGRDIQERQPVVGRRENCQRICRLRSLVSFLGSHQRFVLLAVWWAVRLDPRSPLSCTLSRKGFLAGCYSAIHRSLKTVSPFRVNLPLEVTAVLANIQYQCMRVYKGPAISVQL